MSDISISNYGQYSSNNYGGHTLRVDVGFLSLWFSYETVVAFRLLPGDKVVHKNVWGTTTGKHLNWIDGGRREDRVDGDVFDEKLNAALVECGLAELPAVR